MAQRTDDDSWDAASGVGATATMVATARALASMRSRALIDDPFADTLVRAVGMPYFTGLLAGERSAGDRGYDVSHMVNHMAVRTRFFDRVFLDATGGGVRQAVILGAGLDTRAYRLPWPAGTTVYEIDLPKVLEFKTATLTASGAQPAATHRPVPIDLREDWPAALRRTGFVSAEPAVWSAEGLLMYLPPEAQDALFDNVTALSAPGSRLAADFLPDMSVFEKLRDAPDERWDRWGTGIEQLIYSGPRSDVSSYLAALGWRGEICTTRELFALAELPYPDSPMYRAFGGGCHIDAVLHR